ncbi:hypothetical protein PMAYCL1PPCAC_17769 [Pristionchus mayeri]|uniref:Kinesin-like protein n=1 Tax=Pristionchus mayeri TaxID=1317129 RepID=A0AAN5CNM5_9BILA|nr:hypothetical protein PMAYCL1PPCAC_17769 [Pristionchus mayeri]
MAESVKVLCRCRPLNDREKALTSKVCVEMMGAEGKVMLFPADNDPPKEFTFDGAYFMDSTAEQIYNESVFPLVESVIEGYNGTVFAYGQTGAGKTFSMQGLEDVPTQKGIIPRAFEHIFETTATTSDMKFLVHASYLEIYNEEVRDLLGDSRNTKLEIKEGGDRGVYVAGLSMHVCHNVSGCADLMKKGFNNRHVGATLMNKDSSRSHSIFTVYVEAMNAEGSIRMGKLNLVDLAGSERQSKTGATGDRFKEATKINLSLSALGNVISALVDGKSKHIPYRDSKLTRLLQDSLGGNTKTIMVACISPSDNNFDETLSTLRYANRAKNIKNKPRINEDPKDALLREYQEEIERLKAMVGNGGGAVPIQSFFDVDAERAKLRAEFEEAMNELKNQYEREQTTKAGLQADLVSLKEQFERANANINEVAAHGGKIDADEAKRRIEQLEHTLVGGEQANNEALKQKRLAKIKESEKKTQRLAAALNVRSDDPLLQVYSSTQEKLDAVTNQLKKEQAKVKSFQAEIEDLHGEFELDRLDYLETIRKQDQALKLHTALLEKVAPLIRKDCNFANLEKVKRDAVWNDDEGRWILPEVAITRTTLPGMNGIGLGAGINHAITSHISSAFEDDESKLRKKLAKSTEDAAKNYFQPSKKMDLASKYREDSKRHNAVGNRFSSFAPVSTFDKLLSGVVYTDDVYSSAHRFSPINNNNIVNSVMKRPAGKLDSLPARI